MNECSKWGLMSFDFQIRYRPLRYVIQKETSFALGTNSSA